MDGGTAQRHPFKIFALAVFRVALRVGTKIRGARSERMGWVRQDTVNELIDGSRDWAKTMPASPKHWAAKTDRRFPTPFPENQNENCKYAQRVRSRVPRGN
jgi:hypothetical protein